MVHATAGMRSAAVRLLRDIPVERFPRVKRIRSMALALGTLDHPQTGRTAECRVIAGQCTMPMRIGALDCKTHGAQS